MLRLVAVADNRQGPDGPDSSNLERESGAEHDMAWFEDDGYASEGASESGIPDFRGVGPETNAFLWALEGNQLTPFDPDNAPTPPPAPTPRTC